GTPHCQGCTPHLTEEGHMNWFLRICLMGGVCFLALLPTAAPAQPENPAKDPSKGGVKADEERLTMDSLKAILEGLAYDEYKELKAKDLRGRFETMCSDLKSNEALWNPAKWPTNKPAENPPVPPKGN